MNRLFIVKIGGNVLDDEKALASFLTDFASIRHPKILIHGGGKIATRIGDQLGIESHYIKGRRITDEPTLDLVTMVYGGLVNKKIVAELQRLGNNAIGLTGADGNLIHATRRPVGETDFGFVGDILPAGVNTSLLYFLLQQNTIPVFAPLTHEAGTMLNTNADTIASCLAIALAKHFEVRLIFCFEKKGVLLDPQVEDSVINHLPVARYQALLPTGVFTDGILPKLENAFQSIHKGVHEVLIGHANDLLANTGQTTKGTLITT